MKKATGFNERMRHQNLIVFDMDGVLIDVGASYRDVVRQTAGLFFQPARDSERLPDPLFPLSDLAALKHSGGLNNDWDLTCLVVSLLFSAAETPKIDDHPDAWTRYRRTIAGCGVARLAEFLKSTPAPLARLLEKKGRTLDPFVAGLYAGDVGSGNVIKQIFQEVYLGPDLFQSTYHRAAQIYRGEGLIRRESLLADPRLLKRLAEKNILAIATGRPAAEADYALQRFGLKEYFTLVYCLEDCLQEEKKMLQARGEKVSLSKPHPFMLDAIAGGLKDRFRNCYYVGDMPDDMQAAANSRFGFKGIGILLSAPDRPALQRQLEQAGADYLIDDFNALEEIVLNRSGSTSPV